MPNPKALLPFTALALAACAPILPEDGALTLVPYDVEPSGRILLDARVDDHGPFRFALDTAASISLVSPGLRDEVGLTPLPDQSVIVHGLVASERLPLARVDHIQIGEVSWNDAEVVPLAGETAATAAIDGVLGIDFMQHYAIGFSHREGVLRLYAPEVVSARTYRGWASIPLRPRNIGNSRQPLYFLEINIGDRTVPAMFDLGSAANIMNTPASAYIGIAPSTLNGVEVVSGPLAGAVVYARVQSDAVATQGVQWRNTDFLVADLEIFSTLGSTDDPLAILGSGLFNRRDFVIDFVRNRLLVRLSSR